MIILPRSTEFNKKIPKQKFYDKLDISTRLKRSFIDEIEAVYWKNKISEDTINIRAGEEVEEIQIFFIELKEKKLDEKVLLQIDSQIPYHIVFILNYRELYQLAIGYKEEVVSGKEIFKVYNYYYSEWLAEGDLSLSSRGLNLDKVYENFLKDIRGLNFETSENESISDLVERDSQIEDLTKEINKLKNKKRKTKQLNKKMKISDQIRQVEKKLEKL